MLKRRSLRSSFVLTFGGAALASTAIAAGCGGHADPIGNPPPVTPDAGDSGRDPHCPATVPDASSACVVPNGVRCDYTNACGGGRVAECVDGKWSVFIANPPPPQCPVAPPTEGAACCGSFTGFCEYGNCADAGPAGPRGFSCQQGTWRMAVSSCNPPPPQWDAGLDASDSGHD